MFDPRIGFLLRRTARLFGRLGPATTDSALLDRLARERDAEAFGELLARHGPAVWALCRRSVRSEEDAEDVFQATFLVLVRDADRVRKAASVGSYLYGVAARIARKVRARADRLLDPARLRLPSAPEPADAPSWNEVRLALDEELARLSDELRAPILLCYFDGLTQDEIATELGWSARAVKDRIARARALLRARLTRRGIELPAALAVPLLVAAPSGAVPSRVLHSLTAAAPHLVKGRPPGDALAPGVTALARSETSAMSSVRLAVLIASAAGLLVAGSLVGRPFDPAPLPARASPDPPPEAEPLRQPGTVRIGTTLFRPDAGWHKKVFFTTDGKTLVAPQESNVIELWDAEAGRRLHEIPVPKSQFHDSDFLAGSNLLILLGTLWPEDPAGKTESMIWFVDTAARKVTRTIRLPEDDRSNHHTLRFTPDGKRFVTATDNEIRVWDVKSGEELIRQKHRAGADAFALSPDGKTIAFGRYDVFLWKWESGEEPKKFAAIGGYGTELVAFGGGGKELFVATRGRVAIFDTASGRQTGTFEIGAAPWKWALGPDGKTLAIAFYSVTRGSALEHSVLLWDTVAKKEHMRLPVGRTKATNPNWSPDGTKLAATTDCRICVWDVKTGKPIGPSAPGHEGFITAFAFTADGRLFTASDDHTVRSWDPTGKPGLELVHSSWVRAVAVSPDGALVAGSALEDDLRVWDAKTGRERFQLLGNGRVGGTRKVQFTPDGKLLVAWGDDLYLRVWDARNGKLRAEHRTLPDGTTEAQLEDDFAMRHILGLGAADISADGSTFALCPYQLVQVFDVASGKERTRFEVDPNGAAKLALSPDGKRIAIGGRGKALETRLPDGRTRHSTAEEHRTAVWDIAAKKMIWQTTSPGSWSGEVAFAPDGTRLAEIVSSEDKKYSVRVWTADAGKELGRIELPVRGHHCAFDRTGKRLAVSHWNTTATIFDLETALKPNAPK